MQGRIDQILAGFAEGDAITNEALILRDMFREWGIESDIFADLRSVAPDSVGRCRPLPDYKGCEQDTAIHHYSISSPAVRVFLGAPAKKVLMYHNITPGSFFDGYDDGVASLLREGRREIAAILPQMDAVWAVSNFNARELTELGARSARVLPLLFSTSQFDVGSDSYAAGAFAVPMRSILFVGRIAPNKRLEDLITAFAWYNRSIERQSRLIVVGSDRSAPRYFTMLRMLVSELDLQNVCVERFVPQKRLPGYYEIADVFVTASEHEGYCLPLVEAMHKGVPVIAKHSGGMPEALGGAGITYDELSAGELAELISRVINDGQLRQEVLASQERRMSELRARRADEEVRKLLDEIP